jgi:hypothetical protein
MRGMAGSPHGPWRLGPEMIRLQGLGMKRVLPLDVPAHRIADQKLVAQRLDLQGAGRRGRYRRLGRALGGGLSD